MAVLESDDMFSEGDPNIATPIGWSQLYRSMLGERDSGTANASVSNIATKQGEADSVDLVRVDDLLKKWTNVRI